MTELSSFQTKEGNLLMTTVEPWEVSSFYTFCSNCNHFIEFHRKSEEKGFDPLDIAQAYKQALQGIYDLLNGTQEVDHGFLRDIIERVLNQNPLPTEESWLKYYTIKIVPILP